MSVYLVTGAAGFIGRNLAAALLQRGEQVRGVDDFSTGRRDNLRGLEAMDFAEGDVNDGALLDRLLRGADHVLHQAAIPSVPRSLTDPLRTHRANVDGTLSVLEAARRNGRLRSVVCASSSSVYGETVVLPKVESLASAPVSPYAVQKLAAENYCRVYARHYGVPAVALRYFNVFGPHQDPESEYAAVIPRFVRAVMRGEPPVIYGDGKQTRDFTYVDNAVEANLLAASVPEARGEAFNVGCGARVDLLTVIAEINRVLGKSLQPRFEPARPGDLRDSLADIAKARRVLGYRAAVPFRDGLERAVGWYTAMA